MLLASLLLLTFTVHCTVYIPSATGVSIGSGIHPYVVCTPNVPVVSCAAVDSAVADFLTSVYVPGVSFLL
jgi:hypothetical protein